MDRVALRTKVTRCYHQSSSRHAVLPPVNRRVSWLPALWPCHRRRCCHGAGPSSSSITAAMPTPSSAQRNQQPTNASNTASLCQSFLYILIITRQILYGRPPITILLCTIPILYEHHHKHNSDHCTSPFIRLSTHRTLTNATGCSTRQRRSLFCYIGLQIGAHSSSPPTIGR
jgi:hypothetical protein